ncbi:MAG: PAS domain S-box protein, partial [Oxalobacteraceae bacterium]
MPRKDVEGTIAGYISIRYDITRRKQAEVALLEENRRREQAERLLRDIIEAIPNGITAYDASDRLVLFNSAYREFYGVTAPAIYEGASFEGILRYGLEHGQFLNVRDTEAARDAWLTSRLKDHQTPGRTFIQHVSGDRWLQVQERRSRGGYVVGVRTDVTELK